MTVYSIIIPVSPTNYYHAPYHSLHFRFPVFLSLSHAPYLHDLQISLLRDNPSKLPGVLIFCGIFFFFYCIFPFYFFPHLMRYDLLVTGGRVHE